MLKISVVTPSYNQAQFLEDCLCSVKQQGWPDVEHIVMDGGSTDGSVEILKKYSAKEGWPHLRWVSERDGGQSDALNKGFKLATGDIIGWLNSDDFYLLECFESISSMFQEYPEIDVIYGDYLLTDKEGNPIQARREIAFNKFVLLHNHMNYIGSSGMLFFSRRIIDQGHLLNVAYHYSMDFEFYLRLLDAGYRFSHIPKLLSAFRWHDESKSGTQARKQVDEMETARREFFARIGVSNPLNEYALGLVLLRAAANVRRWSEKAIRGYYFTQFQPRRSKEILFKLSSLKAR